MQVTHTHVAATEKQVAYAESLARKSGFRFLSDAEKACFGKRKVGGLKRADMSRLIDWLAAR